MEKYRIWDQNIGKIGSPENIGKNRKNRSTGQPVNFKFRSWVFKSTAFFFPRKLYFEPVRDKTNNLGFRPGPTQIGLYSHRSRLKA